jgi:predicted kinase
VEREVVIVSGAPGAGKTTLAVPLAKALDFPLVAKDYVKETMWDALDMPPDGDVAASRRIGAAAMEVLWAIAQNCRQVVLETNFRPFLEYERRRLLGLGGRIVEVRCTCPVELAAERYARRNGSPGSHAAHARRTVTLDFLSQFAPTMGVGPVIAVDTTRPVDVLRLAAEVRSLLTVELSGGRPDSPENVTPSA